MQENVAEDTYPLEMEDFGRLFTGEIRRVVRGRFVLSDAWTLGRRFLGLGTQEGFEVTPLLDPCLPGSVLIRRKRGQGRSGSSLGGLGGRSGVGRRHTVGIRGAERAQPKPWSMHQCGGKFLCDVRKKWLDWRLTQFPPTMTMTAHFLVRRCSSVLLRCLSSPRTEPHRLHPRHSPRPQHIPLYSMGLLSILRKVRLQLDFFVGRSPIIEHSINTTLTHNTLTHFTDQTTRKRDSSPHSRTGSRRKDDVSSPPLRSTH